MVKDFDPNGHINGRLDKLCMTISVLVNTSQGLAKVNALSSSEQRRRLLIFIEKFLLYDASFNIFLFLVRLDG